MQTTPILTLQTAELLLDALDDFLEKSEANFALVIDRGGAVLTQQGDIPDSVDPQIVAALAAGSFAATKELAKRIGEQEFNALHQQGEVSQMLLSAVDEDSVLVTIFGPQTTLGLVRFYSARVVKRIASLLQEGRACQRIGPIFSDEAVPAAGDLFPT